MEVQAVVFGIQYTSMLLIYQILSSSYGFLLRCIPAVDIYYKQYSSVLLKNMVDNTMGFTLSEYVSVHTIR